MTTVEPLGFPRSTRTILRAGPEADAIASGEYLIFSETINQADEDGVTPLFEIPANTFVSEIKVRIVTAFDGDTGGNLEIGDGVDQNGYIAGLTDLAIETAKAGYLSSAKSAQPYAGGKLYTSADTLDAWIDNDGGIAGQFIVGVVFRPFATENPIL